MRLTLLSTSRPLFRVPADRGVAAGTTGRAIQARKPSTRTALAVSLSLHAALLLGFGLSTSKAPPPESPSIDVELIGEESIIKAEVASPEPPQAAAPDHEVVGPQTSPSPPPPAAESQAAPPAVVHAETLQNDEIPATTKPARDVKPMPSQTHRVGPPRPPVPVLPSHPGVRADGQVGTRDKTVSWNTHDPQYSSYIDAWRARVQRSADDNPSEGGRGQLDMVVDVKADGTMAGMRIAHSSGNKAMDNQAIMIVRLAQPFPKFPASLKAKVDVLHIDCDWLFSDETAIR